MLNCCNITSERYIIHQLLLRSGMGVDMGLFHGKMGLILFFAHYYKHTGQQIYEDTADELMAELIEEIKRSTLSIGFASGLSGVGWGMEYLMQNGFMDDDSLEVCDAFDEKIMVKDPRRMTDFSLETGLEGVFHYVLTHIKGVMNQHSKPPFDETYLGDLYQTAKIVLKSPNISEAMRLLASKYSAFYENGMSGLDYTLQLSFIVEDTILEKEISNVTPLGLKNGLTGFLLKSIITT